MIENVERFDRPAAGQPHPGPGRARMFGLVAVALTAALTAALACAGPSSAPPAARTPALPATAAACGSPMTVGDSGNGTTIHLCVGQTLRVELGSTYWVAVGSSNGGVLAQTEATTVDPAPPGTCLPGAGCGTVAATFVAVARGSALISAHRSLCGEAYQCPPSQQRFTLTVVVD